MEVLNLKKAKVLVNHINPNTRMDHSHKCLISGMTPTPVPSRLKPSVNGDGDASSIPSSSARRPRSLPETTQFEGDSSC